MVAHPELIAQNAQFEKKLHKITDSIYAAIGYAASNVGFLIGDNGVVVIDTTETTAAAENVLRDFREVCDLPINTIIYTHSHRDHISGAAVFAEGNAVDIYAADNFSSDLIQVDNARLLPNAALMVRTKRQFGISLTDEERVSLGIGPGQRPMKGMGAGYLEPTIRVSGKTNVTIEGLELQLVKAPGETPDHMVVWIEKQGILFSGDNFYHAFPNLYAIRGTAYRDFDAWADTMDQLMAFEPDVLVPGHTLPVIGKDTIRSFLTGYRDAIRHVISETVNGMNAGLDPLTIADSLRLPKDLASKPYLREFYGHIGHASQAYFAGTLGWFDGNPTSLGRLPPAKEARKVIALAGGSAKVKKAAQSALDDGDTQWAMELADRLIAVGEEMSAARAIKIAGLRQIADQTINAPTRNYYLLSAREIEEAETGA